MVEDCATCRASCYIFAACKELFTRGCDGTSPVSRKFTGVAPLEIIAIRIRSVFNPCCPSGARFATVRPDSPPFVKQRRRNNERRGVPAENFSGTGDFIFARRVAVCLLSSGLGWEAKTD